MSFEAGFDAGERQAFKDRRCGIRRTPETEAQTAYERGFWAGYLPRDPSWALRVQPVAWWQERESGAA